MQIGCQPDPLKNRTNPYLLINAGIDLWPEWRIMFIQCCKSNSQFPNHFSRQYCIFLTIIIPFSKHHGFCKRIFSGYPLKLPLRQFSKCIIIFCGCSAGHTFSSRQCHIVISSMFKCYRFTAQIIPISQRYSVLNLKTVILSALVIG